MAKEVFGEYAAFLTNGGVRFQQNNKMVSEKAVPPEVVAYLTSKLSSQPQDEAQPEPPTPTGKFPRPSEEELKAMREESLRPAPGLELTPEEEAARAAAPLSEPTVPEQPPLEEGDFDDPEQNDIPLTDEQIASIGYQAELLDKGLKPADEATLAPPVDTEFMERTSIYTADLKDIAQALYDRFGIYSIWLNATPQTDEINPITGEGFSRYHQGIAYQALIKARGGGFFNRPAELGMELMTEGRIAHENYTEAVGDPRQRKYAAEGANAPAPAPDSFAYRTSPAANNEKQTHYIAHEPDPVTGELRAVRKEIPQVEQHSGKVNNAGQRYDPNNEEFIVEPQFGKQVVRPNW